MTVREIKKTSPVKNDPPKKDSTVSDSKAKEYGGREGLEPTRYGDWEKKGIISDF